MFLFEAWYNEFNIIPVVAESERAARLRISKYMREFYGKVYKIDDIFCRGKVQSWVSAGFNQAFGVSDPMSLLLNN